MKQQKQSETPKLNSICTKYSHLCTNESNEIELCYQFVWKSSFYRNLCAYDFDSHILCQLKSKTCSVYFIIIVSTEQSEWEIIPLSSN